MATSPWRLGLPPVGIPGAIIVAQQELAHVKREKRRTFPKDRDRAARRRENDLRTGHVPGRS